MQRLRGRFPRYEGQNVAEKVCWFVDGDGQAGVRRLGVARRFVAFVRGCRRCFWLGEAEYGLE